MSNNSMKLKHILINKVYSKKIFAIINDSVYQLFHYSEYCILTSKFFL